MIYVNRLIVDYLRNHYDVIVFKKDRRHLTGNKESIMLRVNGNRYRIGKCVVKIFLENVDTRVEAELKDCLSAYLKLSGFNDVDKWYEYIINEILNGKSKGYGFLYKIERFCFYEYNIPLLI